ncbi:LysR family transcriptional regulator [Marinicella sp. S1101]|uniref:LysR family transcriptional regulator n=1 Tax=Marinicella marina TaxID=2996016 RepID=UPI00226098BB|nr:LysR family transcriptional regulator [Marinicella marina]MCX7555072.1 LysR family transcriptional regulator [Marinicella marina]MDJ1141380.1 LysR family transcriptional regulator [Marinicella marina]
MQNIEDLNTFIRIVEAGSISAAAEQLNTVKSAVSQRLSRLESRLGVQLIQRTTRTQSLTDAGHQYYHSAIEIVEKMAAAEAGVKNQNQALAGRIKLAVPQSFGLMHMSQPLRFFNQQHPEVVLNVDFNDRQVDLLHEGFDLAVRVSQLVDSNLVAKKIAQTHMILCASEKYLQRHGRPKTPNDLRQGHYKLKYAQAKNNWEFKDQQGKTHLINLPTAMIANNGEFMCDAAIDGQGLVLLPDFICSAAIHRGQLVRLLPDYICQNPLNIYAIYPPNKHLPRRVRLLIEFLANYFAGYEFL